MIKETMISTKNGQELLDEAAQDPSLNTLLKKAPPLNGKMMEALIRHLQVERLDWEPKQ